MAPEYTKLADRVRGMLPEGADLHEVGAAVDGWPGPPEQRSALWLLAWSSSSSEARRHVRHRAGERRSI